tara:strand:- start:968 stop:1291 length:324 start_codon:yes stop_codon:yes gene_type:complete
MLLLQDDVERISGLGFKEAFFLMKSEGFVSLKNIEGRCVFHDGEKCTIYSSRPSGCRLYPVIFDVESNRPILDKMCPFSEEFSFSFKILNELSGLYHRLIDERKANV